MEVPGSQTVLERLSCLRPTVSRRAAMSMLFTLVLLRAVGCLGPPQVFAEDLSSPVGRWQLIDDETNSPRGVVEMTEINGELQGRFVEAILRPGEAPGAVCVKCDGARKDQPMLGMIILWGLRKDGAEWNGGHILDPTQGPHLRGRAEARPGGREAARARLHRLLTVRAHPDLEPSAVTTGGLLG